MHFAVIPQNVSYIRHSVVLWVCQLVHCATCPLLSEEAEERQMHSRFCSDCREASCAACGNKIHKWRWFERVKGLKMVDAANAWRWLMQQVKYMCSFGPFFAFHVKLTRKFAPISLLWNCSSRTQFKTLALLSVICFWQVCQIPKVEQLLQFPCNLALSSLLGIDSWGAG